jgi:hypothetical protein
MARQTELSTTNRKETVLDTGGTCRNDLYERELRNRKDPRFRRKKLTFSRPQSVEGVRGKNTDAEKDKKCCNGFKHRGPHTPVQVRCSPVAQSN